MSDSTTLLKKCTKCGTEFPATRKYFYANKARKSGLRADCKSCQNQATLRWRTAHHQNVVQHWRRYSATHREQKRVYNRHYRKTHNEELRQKDRVYALAHKEQRKENMRRYRAEHIEYLREKDRVYSRTKRMEQGEQRREYARRYYAQHPEYALTSRRNRRARLQNIEGAHTAADIAAQLKRQKGRCYYAACGHCELGDDYHVDHVIPVTREGSRNDISNLVISCPTCNFKKGNKLPHEWVEGGRLL